MDSYNEYKRIHYTLAPSGMYVGWTYYENGLYYASHRTIELMAKGVKHQLYLQRKVSTRGYTIDIKETPRDQVPIDRMRQGFLTRAYWGQKTVQKLTPEQIKYNKKIGLFDKKTEPKADVKEPVVEYEYYDYRREGNKLIVIGCKKIAEYNLGDKKEPEPDEPALSGTLHLPLD